jgi:hypothetical protein
MATKNQTNSLALVDTSVPDIISKLNAEISKLQHISDSVYKTPGTIDGFGDIRKETLIPNLIRAYSVVLAKEANYNKAAEDLGLPSYPVFEANGCSAAQWKEDIQLRIAIIEHKDKLDKLVSYRDRVSKFLSEQDQKSLLLKEMEAFLNK